MFKLSQAVIRVLLILNLVVGLLLLAVLAVSLVRPEPFLLRMDEGTLIYMRIVLALILPVMIAAHLIFRRLLAILHTTAAGDPFVLAKGVRLKQIGRALLVIQLCDLAFGAAVTRIEALQGEVSSSWAPSVTGWLAVLLVFVLARIFEQGAHMRDDLELTV
jgi:hypothetical protein